MTSIQIPPGDPAYPEALRGLVTDAEPDPPTLYRRGPLPVLPGVAIVGTRAASVEAIRFARDLAAALGARGLSIWSGGARGIDAAAHEGALDAGAPTVVVTGSGHARPYPAEHAPLFDRVLAAGGALIARVPDDTPPLPALFLQRNAVLAALTLATVVIEAGIESGARSTAAAARRLGRHVCAVPHAPWSPRGAGCALELTLGARAITRAEDVLDVLGLEPPPPRPGPSKRRRKAAGATLPLPVCPSAGEPPEACTGARPPMRPEELIVLDALGSEPAHLDEVCEKTGLTPNRAAEALLTLTLQAVVVEGPAGLFRRALR